MGTMENQPKRQGKRVPIRGRAPKGTMATGQEQPLGEHLQQRYDSFVWQWLDMGRPPTELSLRQDEMAHGFLRASKESEPAVRKLSGVPYLKNGLHEGDQM